MPQGCWTYVLRLGGLLYSLDEVESNCERRPAQRRLYGRSANELPRSPGLVVHAAAKDWLLAVLEEGPCMCCLATVPDCSGQWSAWAGMQGYELPANVCATTSAAEAIKAAQYAIHAVPVQHSREFLHSIKVCSPIPCSGCQPAGTRGICRPWKHLCHLCTASHHLRPASPPCLCLCMDIALTWTSWLRNSDPACASHLITFPKLPLDADTACASRPGPAAPRRARGECEQGPGGRHRAHDERDHPGSPGPPPALRVPLGALLRQGGHDAVPHRRRGCLQGVCCCAGLSQYVPGSYANQLGQTHRTCHCEDRACLLTT